MKTKPKIRIAKINDLPFIVDIYNQAIRSGTATGDMDEFNVEERVEWFREFCAYDFPIYVAVINDKVIGFATMSPYRPGRKAMNKVAELSFYVDYSFLGPGIGSALIEHSISDCNRIGKDNLLAILLDINHTSIQILKKFGFKEWGHFPNIINFNGKICGHYIYGLKVV